MAQITHPTNNMNKGTLNAPETSGCRYIRCRDNHHDQKHDQGTIHGHRGKKCLQRNDENPLHSEIEANVDALETRVAVLEAHESALAEKVQALGCKISKQQNELTN